jgi:hypothetical protein
MFTKLSNDSELEDSDLKIKDLSDVTHCKFACSHEWVNLVAIFFLIISNLNLHSQ